MATYKEIQALIRNQHGFVVKTCWIADCKSQMGFLMRKAPNRQGEARVSPCPPDKAEIIKRAIRELG